MSTTYVGEIRMVGFDFAPAGWLLCNGQTLPISQYQDLFATIGTFYGGNGLNTFQLPNFQGRVPIHQGTGLSTYNLGEANGVEEVILTQGQMPLHTHALNAVNSGGNQASPSGNVPAIESTGTSLNYSSNPANVTMAAGTVASTGGATPVSVVQPYLVVNFMIATTGTLPARP